MSRADSVRLIYAANRAIGVTALQLLCNEGISPVGVMLPHKEVGSHNCQIRAALPGVPVMEGKNIHDAAWLKRLAELKPDYILSVHFPYLFRKEILNIPKIGTLNLHPALLPYNRGWHTPSWAILERKPIGATLHWVDEGIDSGDIALQREEKIRPDDTANTLYKRVLAAEIELFRSAIPLIKERRLPRISQEEEGTSHNKSELSSVQYLDVDRQVRLGDALDVLRALTTDRLCEAAYFIEDDRRYRVQVKISEE